MNIRENPQTARDRKQNALAGERVPSFLFFLKTDDEDYALLRGGT